MAATFELNYYYRFYVFLIILKIFTAALVIGIASGRLQVVKQSLPGIFQQPLNSESVISGVTVPITPCKAESRVNKTAWEIFLSSLFIRKALFLRKPYCIFSLSLR